MIRLELQRLGTSAQILGAALVAACALRFAIDAIETVRAPAEVPKAAPRAPRGVMSVQGAAAAPPATTRNITSLPDDRKAAPSKGVIRVQLVVEAGPPRSDVFVAGAKLGQTPFLGDLTCTAGALVKIEILPPQGMPQTFERVCGAGGIRVRDAR